MHGKKLRCGQFCFNHGWSRIKMPSKIFYWQKYFSCWKVNKYFKTAQKTSENVTGKTPFIAHTRASTQRLGFLKKKPHKINDNHNNKKVLLVILSVRGNEIRSNPLTAEKRYKITKMKTKRREWALYECVCATTVQYNGKWSKCLISIWSNRTNIL